MSKAPSVDRNFTAYSNVDVACISRAVTELRVTFNEPFLLQFSDPTEAALTPAWEAINQASVLTAPAKRILPNAHASLGQDAPTLACCSTWCFTSVLTRRFTQAGNGYLLVAELKQVC